MRRHLTMAAAGILAMGLLSGNAWAVSGDPDPLSSTQVKAELAKAQTSINGEKYKAAISTLNDIVRTNPRNADAYNLLGFSYRKSKDFKRAERNYARALRIDPEHKGALEYMGELFLETDRRPKAEELLARLEKLCPNGCEELEELRGAFAGNQSSSTARPRTW
ncbi:MAG: tetratricopeptide repeat protein [Alphaproteobacteria bacterium]|nr:tetratricopeptide repeat protein [Alphaproteobacteria bacterium]